MVAAAGVVGDEDEVGARAVVLDGGGHGVDGRQGDALLGLLGLLFGLGFVYFEGVVAEDHELFDPSVAVEFQDLACLVHIGGCLCSIHYFFMYMCAFCCLLMFFFVCCLFLSFCPSFFASLY